MDNNLILNKIFKYLWCSNVTLKVYVFSMRDLYVYRNWEEFLFRITWNNFKIIFFKLVYVKTGLKSIEIYFKLILIRHESWIWTRPTFNGDKSFFWSQSSSWCLYLHRLLSCSRCTHLCLHASKSSCDSCLYVMPCCLYVSKSVCDSCF